MKQKRLYKGSFLIALSVVKQFSGFCELKTIKRSPEKRVNTCRVGEKRGFSVFGLAVKELLC
jgi:hypothetical protein